MIPVRVPVDVPIHTVGGIRTLMAEHPLYDRDCPVCDGPLTDLPITLVCVGIHPEDRKPSGWTTGGAVAVHAACAGVEPESAS
jgi:hypothetical protein